MGAPLPEIWNPENEPAQVGAGAVTLVEGSSFCICTPGGDLGGAGPNGGFFRDTRILSRWDLRVDGEIPDPLSAMTPDPYRATFLGRLSRRFGRTDTNLLVQRERRIGNGLREDLVLRNPGAEPTTCTVTVAVEADFADLFEVKEGRIQPRGERRGQGQDERLHLVLHRRGPPPGGGGQGPRAPRGCRPLPHARGRGHPGRGHSPGGGGRAARRRRGGGRCSRFRSGEHPVRSSRPRPWGVVDVPVGAPGGGRRGGRTLLPAGPAGTGDPAGPAVAAMAGNHPH